MKIVVFGAFGRTGREFVKIAGAHELRLFKGDILDKSAVSEAIKGMDAVVTLIGHVKGSDPWVQTKGTTNMLEAMKSHGVDRIISLTGSGVRVDGDKITLMDRILNLTISIIDPARVKDGIGHAKLLFESGVGYTIIRVLKLTNGGSTTKKTLGLYGPVAVFVSRKDVARLVLEALSDQKYINTSPLVMDV